MIGSVGPLTSKLLSRDQPNLLTDRVSQAQWLTDAQRETLPYVAEEAKQEARRRGLLKPLEMVFDVLQRGQYLTANIAKKITENVRSGEPILKEVGGAARDALKGKIKGDWETVLFGGETPGEEGDFEGWADWDPETGGGKFARKALGFLANIVLDPTTYISFGPTTAARGAQKAFAKDTLKDAVFRLSGQIDEIVPQLARKGWSRQVFEELWQSKGPKAALNYTKKHGGEDVTRLYSRLIKEAEKSALRKTAEELTEEARGRLMGSTPLPGVKPGVPPAYTGPDAASKQMQLWGPRPKLKRQPEDIGIPRGSEQWAGVSDMFRNQARPDVDFALKRKFDPQSARMASRFSELEKSPYAGAGTRAMKIFGKELFAGERYPKWLQTMDDVKKKMSDSKIGGMFSDAWWNFINQNSVVSGLKKMLHIRNPYQKMLSIIDRDIQEDAFYRVLIDGEVISDVVKDLSEEENKALTGAMIFSQIAQESRREGGEGALFSATELIEKYAPAGSDVGKLRMALEKINFLTFKWEDFNTEALAKGLSGDMGHWEDYLPLMFREDIAKKRAGRQLASAPSSFQRARNVGYTGHLKQQVEKLKWLFDFDEDATTRAITEGFADIETDVASLLTRRAFAQSRFEQRVNMLEQFREFGIDVSALAESRPEVYQSLVGHGGNLARVGLVQVGEPALKDYLFDTDVADIFNRAIQITDGDEGYSKFLNWVNSYTSWFRSWATLSPGFHARNFFSNNITGFLKHGIEWGNIENSLDALAVSQIGLYGKDEAAKKLTGIFSTMVPKDEAAVRVKRLFAKRVGELSIEELGEYAGRKGIATRITRGFYQPQNYDELMKLEGKLIKNFNINPFSKNFTPFNASRNVGTNIESLSRTQSFLLDFKRGVKQGANTDTALDWAKMEAKKWFIDYGDLSDTEKKLLRNVIPFYTWLRGNLANQISGLFTMPQMYSTAAKAEDAISTGMTPEDMPEWARRIGMLPVGEGEEGKTRFWWPNFPYADINKIPLLFGDSGTPIPLGVVPQEPGEIVSNIASDSHPMLKTFIELVTKKDVFYRNEIGDVEKAPRALRILNEKNSTLQFLDGLMRQVGFKNGLNADVDKEGRLLIDSDIAKVLENNIIMLKNLPRFFDLVDVIFPAVEEWQRKTLHTRDDKDALDEFFDVLSFYAGIKLQDIDIEEAEFWRKQEIIEKAQERRTKDMSRRPGYERRGLEWKEQQKELQRRYRL
jgi:hypothetical protein